MGSNLEPVPITSQKHDPAWKHVQMFKNGDKVQLKCIYCLKMFKGGGIHRIKEHLACQKGNASTCSRVPHDVRLHMQQSLDGVVMKKRKKQKIEDEIMNVSPLAVNMVANQVDANEGMQSIAIQNSVEHNSNAVVHAGEGMSKNVERRKKLKAKSSMSIYTNSEAVPAVEKNALFPKRMDNHVQMAIGRFLYDVGAPFDAVNSIYFKQMVEAIASRGSGFECPSHHELGGWILKNSVQEVKNDMDRCRMTWGRTGCSILVDQWSTEGGRVLLNFFAYCPEGTIFLKSFDATEISASAECLYELIRQVVEEVGVGQVLQMITPGEERYAVVGRRLTDTFPTLYWSPSAVHCIDLILEEFEKSLQVHKETIANGRRITTYIYSRASLIALLHYFTKGKHLIRPAVTRCATSYLTLDCLNRNKEVLMRMFTSKSWKSSGFARTTSGRHVENLVMDSKFWKNIVVCLKGANPLIKVLRLVNSDEKPAMGFIYKEINRAKDKIRSAFKKR